MVLIKYKHVQYHDFQGCNEMIIVYNNIEYKTD